MSYLEVQEIKSNLGNINYKQLIRLIYERNHDVSQERFILNRIPV